MVTRLKLCTVLLSSGSLFVKQDPVLVGGKKFYVQQVSETRRFSMQDVEPVTLCRDKITSYAEIFQAIYSIVC